MPFSRTVVVFQGLDKVEHKYDVTSSQPDTTRLFLGGVTGVVGALLLGGAAYDVAVGGRDFFTERPFYETLFGTSLSIVGGAAMLTGWHPAARAFVFPDDVCRAAPLER